MMSWMRLETQEAHARLSTKFSTFPHAHLWITLCACVDWWPWENGGFVAGELPTLLFILIIQYIPNPPRLHCSAGCARLQRGLTCLMVVPWWRWKMMWTGERATPREHQLACCSPCRTCVLRLEQRSGVCHRFPHVPHACRCFPARTGDCASRGLPCIPLMHVSLCWTCVCVRWRSP